MTISLKDLPPVPLKFLDSYVCVQQVQQIATKRLEKGQSQILDTALHVIDIAYSLCEGGSPEMVQKMNHARKKVVIAVDEEILSLKVLKRNDSKIALFIMHHIGKTIADAVFR